MKKLTILALLLFTFSASSEDFSLRITDIKVLDSGTLEESSPYQTIDTVQGECENDTVTTPEPFSDSLIKFTVKNDTEALFRVSALRYTIRLGNGRRVTSKWLSPVGTFDIDAKSSGNILGFFLNEREGLKYYHTKRVKAVTEEGFRSVKFTLKGRKSNGKTFKAMKKTSLSFKDVDRCQ